MVEEFRNLMRVALNEARKLDAAYANKDEFSEGDLKRYDCIMHGLKCQMTAEAMMEASGGGESRSMNHEPNNSYNSGFSQGYSAAMANMNQANNGSSGHWPGKEPYYPEPRRW